MIFFKHIRLTFFAVLILSHFTILSAQEVSLPKDKENFHVFLLMGQSNMEGGSAGGQMDTIPHERILKMNSSGGWEQATDPITNNRSNAVGPGFAFAKKLVEENPDITVGLIPMAVGGTPISLWMKGTDFYLKSLEAAQIARQSGVIKGVLWHQGEHDTFTVYTATNYKKNLIQLIDDIRKDLQDPYLPFIVGGFTDSSYSQADINRITVWNRIKDVGTTFFRTGYVQSAGADYIDGNEIHFSAEGQRVMGERYADEYLRISGFDQDHPLVGHWTLKAKKLLDDEAVDNGDGWKYHPSIGVYYDEKYPIIKHAQLGWLTLEADAQMNMRINSPFIGKNMSHYGRESRSIGNYLILKDDDLENAIYIYLEDISNPEAPTYASPFFVNLLALPGDEFAFFDHGTDGGYLTTLENLPIFKDSWEYNRVTEALFVKAQESDQLLRNTIEEGGNWSDMRRLVDDVQYYRDLINLISWEAYHYASENETGNLREFWMDHFLLLLYTIGPFVVSSQNDYQDATDILLAQ